MHLLYSRVPTESSGTAVEQQSLCGLPLEAWISLAHDLLNFERGRAVQVLQSRNSERRLIDHFSFCAEAKNGQLALSNLPVEILLDFFDADQLLAVLELLLMERKLVFVTKQTGRVALFIECLFSLLYPL